MTIDQSLSAGPRDPTSLPLFAPAHRPGRVRGTFSMPRASRILDHPPATSSRAPTRPERSGQPDVDWPLVAAFRSQVADRLAKTIADRAATGPGGTSTAGADKAAQEELGRTLIGELLDGYAVDSVADGAGSWSRVEQEAMAEAVFNAVFRLGRLQPLVDDERVENIIITAHDRVLLETVDGQKLPGPPVADSDEELIDFLRFLASRSEANPRPFAESTPSLHMRLDGGARLAATAWVTPHPSIVIRRHRLRVVELEDLVDLGEMSPVAASFLRAAVLAKRSIVVGGEMGAGKTTLVRALCAEIPREEAIGTFETEYELFLDEEPNAHDVVIAWEARPGTGERTADGHQAGEFTLAAALRDSYRFNLTRQIVGEIRGEEVWTMIKAMESGTGSISTTHASDAQACLRKLVTCAMEAGPHVSHELATSKLSECLDIVVHLHLQTTRTGDGASTRSRWVSEIVVVEPGEKEKGYALTHVFGPSPDGPARATGVLPEGYRDLAAHGFDLRGYLQESQRWEATS